MRRKSFSFIQSISVLLVFELFAFTYPIYAQDLSGKVYEGQTGTEPPPLGNAKPIEGATVSLYGSGDENDDGTGMGRNPIKTTTTNSEGWYSLTVRGAYDFYNIVQTNKTDYTDSGATSVGGTVKSSNWIQYRYEDIFVTPVTMTGNKFWDIKEGQEPPENNPPVANNDLVTLVQGPADINVLINDNDPDGDPLQIISVTNPANGTTVIIGNRIRYTPDPGFKGTDNFDYTVSDGKNTDTATVTITFVSPGTGALEGHKFDTDTGEGLENWRIFIDLNGNGEWDSGEPNDATDSNGYYKIINLEGGTYRVCEQMQEGWEPASGAACVEGVTILIMSVKTQDFYNRRTGGPAGEVIIRGVKYNDLNDDGIKDPGEPELGGWQITLEDGDHNLLSTATTDTDGQYTLTITEPGTYFIAEVQKPGWRQTDPFFEGSPSAHWFLFSELPSYAVIDHYNFGNYQERPLEGEWDFGDAPEGRGYNYPTTLANNGARHRIVRNGPWLGDSSSKPDPEPDGQPDTLASGDDVDGNDDESDPGWLMCQGKSGRMDIEVGERGGHVDVWVDFNGDGIWQHPQERVLSQYLPYFHFAYSITVPVPVHSIIGKTFARFRINSKGPLPPYGPAEDGEVEDHSLSIYGVDYGDAPDPPYPTLNASGAPWLSISGLMLGTLIDPEPDGQPDPNALGDDNDGTNDDDGVTFKTKLIRNQEATVEVLCSGNFTSSDLHGWIDFNQNGIWETTEEIINASVIASGTPDTYKFTVPNGAKLGLTYARFIIRAIIQSTCECDIFGEIEDYAVVIGEDGPYPPPVTGEYDFGDAPDSYGTSIANNGASHIAYTLRLGPTVDTELDGHPSTDALGDDNAVSDDEDGLVSSLVDVSSGEIRLTAWNVGSANEDAMVAGWIDFDGNGQFDPTAEPIGFHNVTVPAGGQTDVTFHFGVPTSASTGETFARFRLYWVDPNPMAPQWAVLPLGEAGKGEVEDYMVNIQGGVSPDDRDYGDAPYDGITTFYPSANHQVGGPWWGDFSDLPDVENGMQRDVQAMGDDTDVHGDDENGLFAYNLVQGQGGGLYVSFVPGGSGEVTLHGWIDFNRDGDWDDAGEASGPWPLALGPIPTGGWPNPINIILPFAVPAQAQVGQTFARLRIEEGLLGFISHTGSAGAGEVEDHLVEIKASGTPVPSTGMIWGIKFQDLNGNGIWEAGTEPVLPNWTIWLDTNHTGMHDAADSTTQTDGLGLFIFTGLMPGTYLVGEEQQTGWMQTWPAAPWTHTVTVQPNTLPWGILFGNQQIGAGLPLDWGDAPDPNYPTLRASNGAYHVIVPGIFLGGGVDPEIDGQPTPDALGDDFSVGDDEDGVTFITPLMPGQQAEVEVMASVGYLDAWIDFDADGNWSQASDQIFQSKFIVAAGAYIFDFQVPSGAAINIDTYARFRFSSTGAFSPYGPAQDGEVEDYHILLGEDGPDIPVGDEQPHVKWSQPPIEIDPNIEEPPVFCGWNESARSTEQTGDEKRQWRMDADDFRCLGPIPVTKIRWWGGYKAWTSPEPPELQPDAWHIGFWANQIESIDKEELFPERPVWLLEIPAERIHFEPVGLNEFPEKQPEMCFLYELNLEPEEWFHQVAYESNYDIFWISITAIYPADAQQINMWGWTTRPHIWGHGAVMPAIMGDWPTYDERLFPGRIYPIENSLLCGRNQGYDMCFELLTEPFWVKWDQPFTSLRDWPYSEDQVSFAIEHEDGNLQVECRVADNWLCERIDPVNAISWQGSYIGYGYEPSKCDQVEEPRRPDYFILSLRMPTNVPAGDGNPSELVWEYLAYDYDEVLVGYDRNPEGEPNEPVFRYSVRLPEDAWFRQEHLDQIYWFSVVAVFRESNGEIPYWWGWTNRPHMFGSPAISITRDNFVPEPIYDQTSEPVDMSFTLFTAPQ